MPFLTPEEALAKLGSSEAPPLGRVGLARAAPLGEKLPYIGEGNPLPHDHNQ